jgi:hypothetical protein
VPRRNRDRVKTQLEFGMFGMRGEPGLRGIDDPRLLAWRHRKGRLVQACAGLDLDQGQNFSPFSDDIDLAVGRSKAFCQDAITLGHQKSGGAAFRR